MLAETLASARELFDRTSRRIALPSTESTLALVSDCANVLKILRQVCWSRCFFCCAVGQKLLVPWLVVVLAIQESGDSESVFDVWAGYVDGCGHLVGPGRSQPGF